MEGEDENSNNHQIGKQQSNKSRIVKDQNNYFKDNSSSS